MIEGNEVTKLEQKLVFAFSSGGTGTVETSGNESSGMLRPILIMKLSPPSLSFLIRQKTSDPDQRAGTARVHKLPTAAIAT
jgi:hypothetical protein